MKNSESYSSAVVAEAAQISLRTLQWWDEQGIVSPSRNGHKRVYSQQDAVSVGVIAELMRKGFKLRRIVPLLKQLDPHSKPNLLLTDCIEMYWFWGVAPDSRQALIRTLEAATKPMALVSLARIRERLAVAKA